MQALRHLGVVLEMIKFEHTLFALPFALMGMLLAAGGVQVVGLVTEVVAGLGIHRRGVRG